jgi:hypothetical protein
MAADALPEFLLAMSMQYAQLGLMVISTPKVAIAKAETAKPGESKNVTAYTPQAAKRNPAAAGTRLDHGLKRERYKRSTKNPETQLAVAPDNSGTIEYFAAWPVSMNSAAPDRETSTRYK